MEVPVSDIEGGVDWAEWPEEAEEEEKEAADPNSLNNKKEHIPRFCFLWWATPLCVFHYVVGTLVSCPWITHTCVVH